MRRPPIAAPVFRARDQRTTLTREYDVITPIFGGGVEKATSDPITPVRGTAIRGHLRFWWRVTRSGRFTSLADLKRFEDALWGAAATEASSASPVQIQVEVQTPGTLVLPFKIIKNERGSYKLRDHPTIPGYFAFPLRPQENDLKTMQRAGKSAAEVERELLRPVLSGVQFRLTIRFSETIPDIGASRPEIEAALWAWETFGGIGARTRRGFGALACRKATEGNQLRLYDAPDAAHAQFLSWLQARIKQHVNITSETRRDDFPVLYPDVAEYCALLSTISPDVNKIWNALAEKLKTFRSTQSEKHWPEPKAVRALHAPEQPTVPLAFPRAVFGLPIVYHFKDNWPPDSMLVGKEIEHTRLASPLILRPVACRNGQYVGLAMLLDAPEQPPGGIRLTGEDVQHPDAELTIDLTESLANEIEVLGGNKDVLMAFLNHVEK